MSFSAIEILQEFADQARLARPRRVPAGGDWTFSVVPPSRAGMTMAITPMIMDVARSVRMRCQRCDGFVERREGLLQPVHLGRCAMGYQAYLNRMS